MADGLIASFIVNTLVNKRKRERFEGDEDDFFYTETGSPTPLLGLEKPKSSWDWFSFIISTLISIVAVYLSWTCNTAQGYGTAEKVLYAVAAGFFGVLYLFYYVLFRGDTCRAALSK